MRIGLYGGAATPDKIVEQAQQAEADGFSAVWYASGVQGDPLVAMALAGRATSTIELGTAVLQTYPCHPLLQAQRAASVTAAMGRPGFTLGVGPSHESNISGIYGLSYDHPGRSTEEYVRILTALLRGEDMDFEGEDWTVRTQEGAVRTPHPVPVLLSALSPRLLRVAGEHADGAVLWMATAAAIEEHVAPRITAAAEAAGRPAPRIVAGLPLAVHDDEDEARGAVAAGAVVYADRPNYQRIMEVGRASGPADAAIVGDEAAVEAQLQSLFDAGATEVYVYVVPVGEDRRASRKRATDLLRKLATS
jgi:F420-dependent oxidoreductase-like protein